MSFVDGLQLRICLGDNPESPKCELGAVVSSHLQETFRQDGFIVIPHFFDASTVLTLNNRLEEVLRGRYDRDRAPDKTPRLIRVERKRENFPHEAAEDRHHHDGRRRNRCRAKTTKSPGGVGPLGFSGNLENVRVLQVINIHKSDRLFRSLAIHPMLGKLVSELAGWQNGARLAQDQVWAKPPGAAPLVFHRDSPYFMFDPPDVVTVWVALDNMDAQIGPLQYARGSHLWGDGRVGSSNQFFEPDGGQSLLRSAARRSGVDDIDIVSMAGLKAGGISIHDGRTWHGSGKNESACRPRRGLGLHFVPADVNFTVEARKSSLWRSYVEQAEDPSKVNLCESDFPITWQPLDDKVAEGGDC